MREREREREKEGERERERERLYFPLERVTVVDGGKQGNGAESRREEESKSHSLRWEGVNVSRLSFRFVPFRFVSPRQAGSSRR